MLHYYAKKFFAPTLLSPYLANGNLSVSVVVDEIPLLEVRDSSTGNLRFQPNSSETVHVTSRLAAVTTGQLVIQMYAWKSFTALKTWRISFKVNISVCSHCRL